MNTPWIESPFFEEEIEKRNLTEEQKRLAWDYRRNGYVVLKGFFDRGLIDHVVEDLQGKGFNPSYRMTEHRDAVRIQDFWRHSPSVRTLATDPRVMETLAFLYGRRPIPFQTLNFRKGSQQRAHSDTIHFSSIPARFMCGVWVALEDVGEKNGPLFYHPGSHTLPEYDYSHFKKTLDDNERQDYLEYENFIDKLMASHRIEKRYFHAEKGDALIWSSNIIHGGSRMLDANSTRYSQVTHYFFEDCIYYTPMLSNMVTKELFLRVDLEDISTGQRVEQSFNGHPVNFLKVSDNKYILSQTPKQGIRALGSLFFQAFSRMFLAKSEP